MKNKPIDKNFIEMGKLITETIFSISQNAQNKNDRDLKDEISNTIYILTKIYVILNKIINHTDQSLVSDKNFAAQMIL